jgi:hypothetical protein
MRHRLKSPVLCWRWRAGFGPTVDDYLALKPEPGVSPLCAPKYSLGYFFADRLRCFIREE